MRRIGVLGGTGHFGRGFAARLSYNYEVLVGSRNIGKAKAVAETLEKLTKNKIEGLSNLDAAEQCDAAVFAVSNLLSEKFVKELDRLLEEKLVISPIVPMTLRNGLFEYSPPDGSAAEWLAERLQKSRIAAALHTIPAGELLKVERKLDYDVFVAARDRKVFEEATSIIKSIKNLRSLYAGPLTVARYIESLTPLLRNISKLNGMRNLSLRVV